MLPVPPPLPSNNIVINKHHPPIKNTATSNNKSNSLCCWASKYPELQQACIKNSFITESAPLNWKYQHFESLLQIGPTCGLVAISMLLYKKKLPSDLIQIAIDKGYTKNGEMFSVKNAHSLLNLVGNKVYLNLKAEISTIPLFSLRMVFLLLDGFTALVPYDSDRNHYPCLRRGNKAHWALITGIIVTNEITDDQEEVHEDNVFVTAKHGKSLHVAIWKLNDLAKSNQNLVEYSRQDTREFVIPECGLAGENGLKGQFILIHPRKENTPCVTQVNTN